MEKPWPRPMEIPVVKPWQNHGNACQPANASQPMPGKTMAGPWEDSPPSRGSCARVPWAVATQIYLLLTCKFPLESPSEQS